MKPGSAWRGKSRRFQNREARADTQKALVDDLLLKVLPPDHPEVVRIKRGGSSGS